MRRIKPSHRVPLAVGTAMRLVVLVLLLSSHPSSQSQRPELVTQLTHAGTVSSIAFSPDGRLVATAGSDRVVKIWDAGRGMLIRNLEGHAGAVRSAAFSADGQRLVTAGQDPSVRIWDVGSGRALQTLTSARAWSGGATFSSDGRFVLSSTIVGESGRAGPDYGLNQLSVWSVETGKRIRSVPTDGSCESMAVTADGSMAACGTGALWDLVALKPLNGSSTGPAPRFDSASFSPNGSLLAVETSFTIQVWDAKRLVRIQEIDERSLVPTAIAFSPDGQVIAAGDARGRIGLWEAATGSRRGDWLETAAGEEITALAFAPDGRTLLSANRGEPLATVTVWDVDGMGLTRARVFTEGDRRQAGATAGGDAGGDATKPPNALYAVRAVRISSEGRALAAGSADGVIRIWDLQSGQLARTLRGHPGNIRDMAFAPDGNTLVATSLGNGRGQGLRTWDVRSGAQLRIFDGILVDKVAFHPDGKTIAAHMELWDTSREQPIERFNRSCEFLSLSPDGRTVACADEVNRFTTDRQTIVLLDVASKKELRTLRGHDSRITSAVFTPDSGRLVTGGEDRTVRLWDVQSGRQIVTMSHTAPVRAVTVDPKGRLIASGGDDNVVRLWDARGRPVATLTGHANVVTSLSFGPEGTTLASGSEDGSVRVWSAASGAHLLTLLAFDDGEWLAYGPQGHYNGSGGRGRYVAWRLGNTVYDFDQFFERFYTPDLVVRTFQGAAPVAAAMPVGTATPPSVVMLSPRPGQVFREPDVEVAVEVRDTGGGATDVRLSLNGKQVDATTAPATRALRPSTAGASVLTYRVSLLDGDNVLRATAFSADRTESAPHELSVRLEAPVKEATLRLLTVGISKYENPGLSLTFPTADARDLAAFFKTSGQRLFREVDVVALSDESATDANIMDAVVALQRRALPQDVVVVFLAGHGASAGTSWYFVPYNVRNPEQENELTARGISSDRLAQELRRVSSQKVLLLVDACYSGSMLTAFRGYEERKALALLARSAGIHILAAATRDQRASEVPELGHGVFSYALLRGLAGGAALRDADKRVTVMSLVAYIRDQLPDLGRQYRAEVQDPVSFSSGMDFPLAITR
jgi:WD40 repeat protein